MSNNHIDTVAILDAGSQFSKLIDRRIRELQIRTEIIPLSTTAQIIQEKNYKALIISGGPGSVTRIENTSFDSGILNLNIPILGICYGMQLIVKLFNGVVESLDYSRQDGQIDVTINSSNLLYESIPNVAKVLLTHGDICTKIPTEFNCDVKSVGGIVCGISHRKLPIYGVQYHPEVSLTEIGYQLFENFLFKISRCRPEFTIDNRLDATINEIRNFISKFNNNYHVLVLLSGGVDSLVCGTLVTKALSPERVHLVHIDHGFMRFRESESVEQQLKAIGMGLKVYNCAREFLWAKTSIQSKLSKGIQQDLQEGLNQSENDLIIDPYEITSMKPANNHKRHPVPLVMVDTGPLCTIVEPENKRKIIGDTFIMICRKIMADLNLNPDETIIAQGTLRPDLIESASKMASDCADKIKTHHNDTDLVRNLRERGLVLEPLKDFHKDEVRKLGIDLGLDSRLVNRHPFPGPGLAIRILCNDSLESKANFDSFATTQAMLNHMVNYHLRLKMKRTNSMFDEIKTNLTENELTYLDELTSVHVNNPLFCHILPINSVGIQGDGRSYKHPVVISSDTNEPDWSNLMELTKFITKICHNINRVLYAFGGRITEKVIDKLTLCHLSPPIIQLLKEVDHIATDALIEFDDYNRISQMPVILIPVQFDNVDFSDHAVMQLSVILRPVITTDFMTALPAVPGVDISIETLIQIQNRILQNVPRISRVLYDLTGKPPATIEWE